MAFDDKELNQKHKEIAELKKRLKLKKEVFELIKARKNEKAKKILEEYSEILSYFIKFKREKNDNGSELGKVISLSLNGGWIIRYHSYYENEINEDLEQLRKGIEEKENRLEEYIFLKQQQEFLSIQKIDIDENKKDRKRMQEFTFILAFGVIIAALFDIFQIYDEFKKANSLHLLIISGIFIVLFVLMVIFIFTNFNMQSEIKFFFMKQWPAVIISIIVIGPLVFFLLYVPDIELITQNHNSTEIVNSTFENNNFPTIITVNNLSNQTPITNETEN